MKIPRALEIPCKCRDLRDAWPHVPAIVLVIVRWRIANIDFRVRRNVENCASRRKKLRLLYGFIDILRKKFIKL